MGDADTFQEAADEQRDVVDGLYRALEHTGNAKNSDVLDSREQAVKLDIAEELIGDVALELGAGVIGLLNAADRERLKAIEEVGDG